MAGLDCDVLVMGSAEIVPDPCSEDVCTVIVREDWIGGKRLLVVIEKACNLFE